MKKLRLTLSALVLLAAPCLAQYQFTQVNFPGAAQTEVIAINNERQYVGASIDADGTNHAIFFDGHTLSLLDPNGVVGENFSFALSINNSGDIAGGYFDSSNVAHGFLFAGGHVTNIDFPGATGTFAFGVNDRHEVIGVYADTTTVQHAFLLRNGVFTNIDLPGGAGNTPTTPFSINNSSEIVGQFVNVAGTTGHGYLEFRDGQFSTYDALGAPANSTFFISINNLNQILGAWVDANSVNHNFVLSQDSFHNFNVPKSFGAIQVSGQTINDLGDIVGWFADSQNVQHGFIARLDASENPGH
jgi:probable HAF family extracellular repeat protein